MIMLKKASLRQKRYHDQKASDESFQEMKVWLFTPVKKLGLCPKLSKHWDGSFLLTHKLCT